MRRLLRTIKDRLRRFGGWLRDPLPRWAVLLAFTIPAAGQAIVAERNQNRDAEISVLAKGNDRAITQIEKLRRERAAANSKTDFDNCVRVNRADRHNNEQDQTLLELLDAATDTRQETFDRVATEQRVATSRRIRNRRNDYRVIDRVFPRNCHAQPSQAPFEGIPRRPR